MTVNLMECASIREKGVREYDENDEVLFQFDYLTYQIWTTVSESKSGVIANCDFQTFAFISN